MRPLPVFGTVLLTAALAYYIYIPLPDAIQQPWRLMMLDAALRTTMSLVSMDLTVALGDRCHSAGVKRQSWSVQRTRSLQLRSVKTGFEF